MCDPHTSCLLLCHMQSLQPASLSPTLPLTQTPEEGAWSSVHAAVAPEMEGIGGHYLYNEKDTRSLAVTYDRELQRQLWARSCAMTGLRDTSDDVM